VERALHDLLIDSVILFAPTNTPDLHGLRSWSTSGTTCDARVVWANDVVRDTDGQEIPTRATVYLASTSTGVDQTYRVRLPGGAEPPIVGVDRFPDERGVHHYRLRLGPS